MPLHNGVKIPRVAESDTAVKLNSLSLFQQFLNADYYSILHISFHGLSISQNNVNFLESLKIQENFKVKHIIYI